MALSILEAITRLGTLVVAAEHAKHEALERAALLVADEARAEIGHYQDGWAQLAESTVEDRIHAGYAPDEPLLREGDLRDSIGHKVEGNKAIVGSDSEIAVYQELGTDRIPPRSFLASAAHRKAEEVARIIGSVAVEAMVERG